MNRKKERERGDRESWKKRKKKVKGKDDGDKKVESELLQSYIYSIIAA